MKNREGQTGQEHFILFYIPSALYPFSWDFSFFPPYSHDTTKNEGKVYQEKIK
jgi:hypothetical protein